MLDDGVFGNGLAVESSVEVLDSDPVHILHVHCVLLVLVAARVQHDGLVAETFLVHLSTLVDTRTTLLWHVHLVFLGPLVESFTAVLIIEQCAISVNLYVEQLVQCFLFVLVERSGALWNLIDAFIDISLLPLNEGQVLSLVPGIVRHCHLATVAPRHQRPVLSKIVLSVAPVPLSNDGH